jgi:predicted permease
MVWRQNALRAYRALLFLYPAEFRHEYGEEMESLFETRLKKESHPRLWLEAFSDVAIAAAREHLHILADDLRHGARGLAKTPRFVIAALLAIVLGVSATTTVFSLINAVLLRSLPYGNAERLVYMWTPSPSTAGGERERQPSYADMVAWRTMSRSFQDITAIQRYMALLNDGSPERMGAARVLGNFFQTLEAHPQLGRTIDTDDDQLGKRWVVVLSDRIWQSRFRGNPTVLGKTIHIDRQPYRVIGVMPKEFSYPHGNDFPGQYQFASLPRTDIWVPAAVTPKQQADREFDGFDAVIGRRRPAMSFSQAQSEMSAIEKRLDPRHAEHDRDLQALLVPFIETAIGPVRPLLHLLMGAVCLVLLMVCGNFASLLMARAADRIHELGVRTALGAQRSRLVRLMLTESVMLSVAGGALAVPLSYIVLKTLARLNPGDIPRFEETTLDMRVLLFGLSVSIATGLISGIFPAVSASLVNVGELIRQGSRGIAGASWRARNALMVSEIALAVVLLTGAGLLIRSYLFVQGEDKGFAESTLTMSVLLDEPTNHADTLRRELMDRIRVVPGVQVAGSIDDLPLSTFQDKGYIDVEGRPNRLKQLASARETGGEYFRAMHIPLIAGRYVDDNDIPASSAAWPKAVVVSDSFAKRYFPSQKAVGHRLRINGSPWSPIVGVVGDVRHSSLEEAPEPIVYCQNGLADSVAIRTFGAPEAIVASIRRAVSEFHAGFTVTDVQTMNHYVDQATARRRFQTVTLTSFAGVAGLLALVGLYGLLSYAVGQRTAEIGVRVTMGASRSAVIRMVALYGLKLATAGLTIGVCLAFALTRAMASFLYGVRAVDPLTFVAVPAFIIVVAVTACIAPAWKAACIDPVSALRHQ